MKRSTILFVDDEPNVTAALKRSLRKEPYDILSATTAEDALKILGQREIDVVVSDEMMPGMSGTEFLSVVREKYPKTVRMILTGQASVDAAIRAINEGGVYRFFTKPCNEADLNVSIRQALQRRDLAQQSRLLLQEYRRQTSLLDTLERENPGISRVQTDGSGAIIVEEVEEDLSALLGQIEAEFGEASA